MFKDLCKSDKGFWVKSAPKGPLPLPTPPVNTTVSKSSLPDDKRVGSSARSVEDKMAALRSFRRAKGLCDRCAEKWHRGHTCATTMQL